jgi:hypothetical protein
MSFSFTVTATRGDVEAAVADAAARYDLTFAGDAADTTREVIGKVAALAQAQAEAIGRAGDVIAVSVSGHSNPDHAPRDGWAGETLMISVSQVVN